MLKKACGDREAPKLRCRTTVCFYKKKYLKAFKSSHQIKIILLSPVLYLINGLSETSRLSVIIQAIPHATSVIYSFSPVLYIHGFQRLLVWLSFRSPVSTWLELDLQPRQLFSPCLQSWPRPQSSDRSEPATCRQNLNAIIIVE